VSRRGRELSEEERALWRGVARSIKPLRKRARVAEEEGEAVLAAPKPVKATKATARTSARPTAKPTKIVRPTPPTAPPIIKLVPPPSLVPLARREKQQLARGRTAIDARVDLHGMTQAEAHAALAHFLRRAQHDGAKFALVVTGKGARSADSERGILRRQVPHWLRLPDLRDVVLGFEEAHVSHGGEGALYVRLKRMR
jgi:DNA-nicking Smr family endonuclease